jgi:hypothetical protein
MKKRFFLCLAVAWVAASMLALAQRGTRPDEVRRLKSIFATPPADFSSAPLWVWNDQLTDAMVVETLRDLSAQHVKQVFIHPRPGLMTPYLSAEWFRFWNVALEEAKRLGMKAWIYDENSYPSGFAGGFVPDAMPESRGLGLVLKEQAAPVKWSEDILAVYATDGRTARDVTADARAGAHLPEGQYLQASIAKAGTGPWYGGKFYVDLLRPGVTEKFLSVTLDAYKREIGSEFGKRVPGVFTDEPELRPAGGLPWTEGLPATFERRWGYAIGTGLPSLAVPVGDWKRVRHNYYQLLLEQFIERWGRPYYEYCERNNLQFTGHYWDHEWPNCQSVPDNMAMSAWQQRPGIDILMNQYAEDVHAQFGNVRAVKEVASVANQLGRSRTLAEGYGAGGWDLRLEDMKRIGDWMYVLGINTLDQHLSYVSLRGARKRDHPQSFSYHEPWWDAYHVSADYFARLSVAMTAGQQINDILVIEPTTTAWMYNTNGKPGPELEALGRNFQALLVSLESAQVEYDLGSEDVMARHGTVEDGALRVGRRSYKTVVLPDLTENLNGPTVALLEGFLKSGGKVLAAGSPPERVDGVASQRARALSTLGGWTPVAAGEMAAALLARQDPAVAITRTTADHGVLFHHRRQVGGGQVLMLVNTSGEFRSSGTIAARAGAVEEWDPTTGKVKPYPFEITPQGTRIRFDLPQAGSLLLYLAARDEIRLKPDVDTAATATPTFTVIGAQAPPMVKRLGPNVLVIDYVDVRAGGESREKTYFYQASQFAFQRNGVERNPWDSAVQFRDELIRRIFPAGSGVEATYRFRIKGNVPRGLSIVVERPELYTITCNGKPVVPAKGQWWLDRAFGRLDISSAARSGENELLLKAAPFTMFHEIEPAYLLGGFSLDADPGGGYSVSMERPLALGAWNEQGHQFYSGGVSYTQHFAITKPAGAYHVQLTRWHGSVAKVTVNGRAAGVVVSAPWSLDVTRLVRPGANTIEVTVVGTLKNTLGPHHGTPSLGTAWPSMFQKAPNPGPPPASDYSTVAYGMFTPFTLVQVARGTR